MLRDRLVRRLLAETDLTFEKALKIAQAMEPANKDVRHLQAQRPETSISARVHKMSVKQDDGQSRACYRCISLQLLANECRLASEKCHKCGKQGHIMKVCRTKSSFGEPNFQGGGKRRRGGQRMHFVSRDEKNCICI